MNTISISLILGILLILVLLYNNYLLRKKLAENTDSANQSDDQNFDINTVIKDIINYHANKILVYDPRKKVMYNYKKKGMFSWKKVYSSIHKDDKSILKNHLKNIFRNPKDSEKFSIRLYNSILNHYEYQQIKIISTYSNRKNDGHIIFTISDISQESKNIQQQLQQINALTDAFQSVNIWAWSYHVDSQKIELTNLHSTVTMNNNEVIRCIKSRDIPRLRFFLKHIIEEKRVGKSVNIDIKFPNTSEYITCEVIAKNVSNKHDNNKTLTGIVRDITEMYRLQKQSQEKMNLLEAITTYMPVGLIAYCTDGYINGINDFLIYQLGLDRTKEEAFRSINLFTQEMIPEEVKIQLKKREPAQFICDIERYQDKLRPFLNHSDALPLVFDVRISAIAHNLKEEAGYVAVLTDITESTKQKKDMEVLKLNLELALYANDTSVWSYDLEKDLVTSVQGPKIQKGFFSLAEYIQLAHINDQKKAQEGFNAIINGEKDQHEMQIRWITNEQVQWMEFNIIPIKEDGVIQRIIGTRRDITHKIHSTAKIETLSLDLSSSHKILSTILHELPGIIFIKDVKDDFKYKVVSNQFCEAVARTTRDHIIGLTDFELFSNYEEAIKFRNDDLSVVHSGPNTITHLHDDNLIINGEQHIFDTKKIYLKLANNEELLIGLSYDITPIIEINQHLIEAKQKAEQSDKLKSAFLANMSHEIRTPLNAIIGFSELLQDCEDAKEKEEYCDIIHSNNEILLHLINDILDLSKIEANAIVFNYEEFDLNKVLSDTFASASKMYSNNLLEFILDIPIDICYIYTDKQRLTQVITNFLSNAAKHTKIGHIKLGYTPELDGYRIFVEDTGYGIPLEKQHLVFNRFEKLDSITQGTGLGLAICKAISKSLNGKIGFTSDLNAGSYFWVWLPSKYQTEKKNEEPLP